MAEGVIALGSAAQIQVAPTTEAAGVYTPGTYANVSYLTSYQRRNNRTTNETAVFMKGTKVVASSSATRNLTLNGLLAVGDTGQQTLRTASEDNSVVAVKILPDGTNGQVLIAKVATDGWDGDPESPQKTSFELNGVTDPTDVGTGL